MRGLLLQGRFLIGEPVASGGGGTVWRAHDVTTGAPVAIKMIVAGGPPAIERFAREARIVASLDHPGIVRYIAHGITPSGTFFLATEWLVGEVLSARIARAPLSLGETIALGRAVADALSAIHAQGVVHRDIKPGNLFLPDSDAARAKILDFGIARARDARELTVPGTPIGTPGYMAPEQVRGEDAIDPAADVFALGCVLFRLLAGVPAFAGDDVVTVLLRTALEDAPDLREVALHVPEALALLVARMLSKKSELRPPDGAAVSAELRAIDEGRGGLSPAGSGDTAALTSEEQRVASIVIAALGPTGPEAPSDRTPPTSPDVNVDALLQMARAALGPLGARVERLGASVLIAIPAERSAASDEAAAAARCALVLRALLPPEARIALATGVSAGEGVPWGEAIERAGAALRTASAHVSLDDVTGSLLRARFVVRETEHGLVLAGERRPSNAAPLVPEPRLFVGRERDIESLRLLARDAFEERRAGAVIVTAPAGTGKSRLASELVEKLRGEMPVTVWIGHADPSLARAPFGMLADLLRRAAGVALGHDLARQQGALADLARRFLPDRDVADSVASRLGAALSPPGAPSESADEAASAGLLGVADRARDAWITLLGAACNAGPVLIVLEDVHLADPTTVDFVGRALQILRDLPLFVVVLARPDLDEAHPRMWPYGCVTRTTLRGLSRAASHRLCRALLPASSDATVDDLVQKADGNPFYLEELARHVREGAPGAAPESVIAMLVSRLRRLDPLERRVLRAASVLGTAFQTRGVAALTGTSTAVARATLERIAEREILVRDGVAEGDDATFAFAHALLRDAAYTMLTPGDRALGHRLAATWLSGLHGARPRVIAEHLVQAGARDEATEWYVRAVQGALEGGDFEAVIALGERAAGLGAAGEDLGWVRLWQAEAHRWRAENEAMEARAAEAMRSFPPGAAAWCAAATVASVAYGRLGRGDDAVALARTLLAACEPAGASRAWQRAAGRVAANLCIGGALDVAEELLQRLESLGDVDADPLVAGAVYEARGEMALKQGRPGHSVPFFEKAAAAYLRADGARFAHRAALAVGAGYRSVGAYEDAARWLQEGRQICERLGLTSAAAGIDHTSVLVLTRLGRHAEARLAADRALATYQASGNRRMEQATRIYLSLLLAETGEWDAAFQEASLAAAPLRGQSGLRAHALSVLARIELVSGHVPQALAAAEEAFALLTAAGTIEEGTALVQLARIECLSASGHVDAARKALFEAEQTLLARADSIDDPAHRRRFLERIPEHGMIMRLARDCRSAAPSA